MNRYIEGVRDALSRTGIVHGSGPTFITGLAVGVGVGLVAGATVALLMTPTTGPEMRREIGGRAKNLARRTENVLSDARHVLKSRQEREAQHYQDRNDIPLGT